MAARKQIGLLALLAAVLHSLASLPLTLSGTYPKFFSRVPTLVAVPANATALNAFGAAPGLAAGAALGAADVEFRVVAAVGPASIITLEAEVCYLLGVLATTLAACIGLTSLPDVARALNWREWRAAQGWGS